MQGSIEVKKMQPNPSAGKVAFAKSRGPNCLARDRLKNLTSLLLLVGRPTTDFPSYFSSSSVTCNGQYRRLVTKAQPFFALEEVLTCQNSRVITFRFNSITHWQMFLLLYDRHICASSRGTYMASPYKAL